MTIPRTLHALYFDGGLLDVFVDQAKALVEAKKRADVLGAPVLVVPFTESATGRVRVEVAR